MEDNVNTNVKKKKWSSSHMPIAFILAVIWAITRMSGVNFSMGGIPGIVLVCACGGVILFEFYKSGDITLNSFSLDMIFAIASIVAVTMAMTLLINKNGITSLCVTDFILSAVILADALMSPINSFRIALRNFMVAGAGGGG